MTWETKCCRTAVKSNLACCSVPALDRLSDNDLTRLTEQNLFQILDYRDSGEIADKPDRLWNGALYTNAPANPMSKEVDANLEKLGNEALTGFDPKAFMLRLYELLPLGNPAYHALGDMLRNWKKAALCSTVRSVKTGPVWVRHWCCLHSARIPIW